jgi:CBS domain-containing protein
MPTQRAEPMLGGMIPLAQTVADVMRQRLASCSTDASLEHVRELMAEHGDRCVVVTADAGDGGAPWGVVSDLDLVAAALVRPLAEQTAGVSATTPAVTVAPRDTVLRAGRLMLAQGVPFLVVVEPSTGLPVGIVATLDLATFLAEHAARV